MNLEIRQMRPQEARDTRRVAVKAFGLFGKFIPAPKEAMIALVDGRIVGGFAYKIKRCGGKKAGLVSWFFMHPDVAGQGIGKQLGDAGVQQMWDEGCDVITTFVRDDNVASWGAFVKNGFARGGVPALVKALGPLGLVQLFPYWFAPLHDFYIAARGGAVEEKRGGLGQVLLFALVNALLLLLSLWAFGAEALVVIGGFLFVLLGGALAGGLGTLFSRERKWRFRMTTGGMGISLLVAVLRGGFFPVFGNLYPEQYENTPRFKRDMAIVAICGWLFYMAAVAMTWVEGTILPPHAMGIAPIFLALKCLPFDGLGSLGGERVWRWNRPLFAIMTVASAALIWQSDALWFLR